MGRILVAGGAMTDVVGTPHGNLAFRDSNPGHVKVAPGGVGRNIAENLTRLGENVVFITAFGDDANASARRAECEALGIDLSRAVPTPGVPGSVYLAVLDERGELSAAVSDARALDAIGHGEMTRALAGIGPVDAVVVDANLSPDAIVALAEIASHSPLFLECVSAAKVNRLKPLVSHATAVHANRREAEALCGQTFDRTLQGARSAARALAELGVAAAFVTAGEQGVAWVAPDSEGALEAPRVEVVDATGAGDAFTAGMITATLAGEEAGSVTAFAIACAALTLREEGATGPWLTRGAVEAEMEAMWG